MAVRRAVSNVEREEMWRRWKRGEHLTEAAAALGRSHPTMQSVLRRCGGVMPPQRHRAANALTLAEREEISRGICAGLSLRRIAEHLGRPACTVCREVKRHGGRERYRAERADRAAWHRSRRPKLCLLARYARLAEVVAGRLQRNWSPQQISRWLEREYPDDETMRVSHEAIYQSLFIQARGALKKELATHLRSQRSMRLPQAARARTSTLRLHDAISIRERPAEAQDRAVPGHWEGDLLCGGRRTQIATLVERRSRFVMLVKIPTKDTQTVVNALSAQALTLPEHLRRTLTWDRGLEMADHQRFTIATDMKVYFCDPRSPWQRGSNENTNGLLRQYFPKGADLSGYTQLELDAVAEELNARPRKTLGYHTPAYMLGVSVASTG